MDTIYLDNAATTPLRGEVREAMASCEDRLFGNPSSTHRVGRQARGALEDARSRVAAALGVSRTEIFFVRGGTESDNLAVLGRARAATLEGRSPHVVTTAVEHKAVLDAARAVPARFGGRCTVLPVDEGGALSLEALDRVLEGEDAPDLVSAMWVNNEVGTIQPMEEIAARCARAGVPLHTDAVQAVGKVPVRLDEVPADLLTLTGHKLHGPRSTGVLVVRNGVDLAPDRLGGSQERGLRPGTEDVAGAVGIALAVELAVREQAAFARTRTALRRALEDRLRAGLAGIRIHGAPGRRAPHILNVGLDGVDGEVLNASLDLEGLAVSAGSACQSGSSRPSHVLEALVGAGGTPDAAIRFSLSRTTTEEEVTRAAEITVAVARRLGVAAPEAVAS